MSRTGQHREGPQARNGLRQERIISACEEHWGKGAKDWRRFVEPHFRSHRRWLYDLTEALPLAASPEAAGVLAALSDLQAQYFPGERADDTLESAFNDAFLDPKWRDSVAIPNEPGVYRLWLWRWRLSLSWLMP